MGRFMFRYPVESYILPFRLTIALPPDNRTVTQLRAEAKRIGMKNASRMRKGALLAALQGFGDRIAV